VREPVRMWASVYSRRRQGTGKRSGEEALSPKKKGWSEAIARSPAQDRTRSCKIMTRPSRPKRYPLEKREGLLWAIESPHAQREILNLQPKDRIGPEKKQTYSF